MSAAAASASAGNQAVSSSANAGASSSANNEDDGYSEDQVKVFSHEGDGENTEHLKSMDLHDIKTELERDAEKAETPKSVSSSVSSPSFTAEGPSVNVTAGSTISPASIRPVLQQSAAMVYANGGVPFMLPPFPTGASSLYPVMRPVKVESDWKVTQAGAAQLNIPTYSYPAGFLPVDQTGIRHAYPFMTLPGQYVTTPMPYHTQFAALGGTVAPNATVQPNSGGVLTQQVKEKKPHIKKPLNAFMLFMKQKRADVIKECTLKESAAINQILGKMWHALDRTEQAKYYEMAREERAKHMQMYPGWSARDNYAVHKKRRKRKVKQAGGVAGDTKTEPTDKSDKDASAVVSVPDNLTTTPTITPTSVTASGQHPMMQTSPPPGGPRNDDEELENNRKCRARFGLDQQHMWCSPCRRKKKCIRYSVGEEECKDVGCEVGVAEEEEDDDEDLVLHRGGGDLVATASTASSVLLSNSEHAHHTSAAGKLPHLLSHDVPVTLQTIPT